MRLLTQSDYGNPKIRREFYCIKSEVGDFFDNFVAFSEYTNFSKYVLGILLLLPALTTRITITLRSIMLASLQMKRILLVQAIL